jgi:drug/metabolite transporter (DMT)-like permease
MFLSVVMFSIYPLLAAQAVETTDPLIFLLVAHAAAAGFALFYGKTIFNKKYGHLKKPRPLFTLTPRLWGTVALTGISSAINHICFIFALMLTSKIGATMIYETWPIIALWLAPVLVPKGENGIRLADYIFGLLAVLGGAFVVASAHPGSATLLTVDFWQNLDPQKTFG